MILLIQTILGRYLAKMEISVVVADLVLGGFFHSTWYYMKNVNFW